VTITYLCTVDEVGSIISKVI